MGFSLLPKSTDFFVLFNRQAQFAVDAATLFATQTRSGSFDAETVQRMREIEHHADDVAHEVMERLNKTFITPFDREDIHNLACALDDVIDMIYTISNRMKVYRIFKADDILMEFAAIIEKSVKTLVVAVEGLRDAKMLKATKEACIEVNRLENVGDAMRDACLARLFETVTDPIHIIKWKEIYAFAEEVLDLCEDVVHIVESIIVKQA
jgi:predicted phosphate transport protein (TIGR00153 family)